MSAFVCSPCHLTALAAYAAVHRCYDGGDVARLSQESKDSVKDVAQHLGNLLLDENRKSVRHRYRESPHHPEYRSFDISPLRLCPVALRGDFPPVEILRAVDCYRYQACEHDGWEGSRAKRLVGDIADHAVRSLPGYADAEWGIACPHPVRAT